MKKIFLNLLKHLIVPSILFGILGYGFVLLMVKSGHRQDPVVLDIAQAGAKAMAIVCGLFYFMTISMVNRSQKVYAKIDCWKKIVEETCDISTLEHTMIQLATYRSSMQCFSIHHMRYANDVIMMARIKINTIKKLDKK